VVGYPLLRSASQSSTVAHHYVSQVPQSAPGYQETLQSVSLTCNAAIDTREVFIWVLVALAAGFVVCSFIDKAKPMG
jgi:hypothetical protein